jgi:type I restriction enzyme S subunit
MPPGTVMLTKRAPVGAVVVNTVPMATNQGFLNFTCGPLLLPAFLAAWLRANRPYLDAVANGSTYPELYASDLVEFEIAVPPREYQERVIAALNAFQIVLAMESSLEQLVVTPEDLSAVQTKARKLRSLRETLLPLLVSGEVGVGDFEASEVTLDAVRA